MDFSVLRAAGVTQEQFADAIGTARGTVNTWVKGGHAPRGAMRPRVEQVLADLQTEVGAGRLPVPVVDAAAATRVALANIVAARDAQAA